MFLDYGFSSRVALALEAKATLEADGIGTAVVSLPCWELFDEQPAAWRAEVLGGAQEDVRRRLAVLHVVRGDHGSEYREPLAVRHRLLRQRAATGDAHHALRTTTRK